MYYEHFGFREPPFSVTPDPRFFYDRSDHREALATLRYGIEARKGFMVITGEAGTGKTVLLRMLVRSLNQDIRTALLFNNTRGSVADLLRAVLQDLGLTPAGADRLSLTGQLNDFLLQQLEDGRIVALLIDEAQDLSHDLLEEIRLLSNFETDSAKLLQIVLVGQPALESKLDGPQLWQLKQRVMLRRRLTPLSSAEVGPYIAWRLHIAGYEGPPLFEPEAIKTIISYASGIPRVINVICDNALDRAWAANGKIVSAAMVERVARDLQLRDPAHPMIDLTGRHSKRAGDEREPREEAATGSTPLGWEAKRGLGLDQNRQLNRIELAPKERPWLAVVTLLSVMILTATALLFYSHRTTRSQWNTPFASEESHGIRSNSFERSLVSIPDTESRQTIEGFSSQQWSERDSSDLRQTPSEHEAAPQELTTDATEAPISPAAPSGTEHLRQTTRSANTVVRSLPPERVRTERNATRGEYGNRGTTRDRAAREAYLEVMSASAVRNGPKPDAEIIATLRPGTWVKLIAERGDYVQIQSLNESEIVGYVQREYGVFEPLRAVVPSKNRQPLSVKSQPSREEHQVRETVGYAPSSDAYFEVMTASAVRKGPQPDAETIATLRPGTWVKLIAKRGDYLQIQSLNDTQISGFVHRQDGMLEPLRTSPLPKH